MLLEYDLWLLNALTNAIVLEPSLLSLSNVLFLDRRFYLDRWITIICVCSCWYLDAKLKVLELLSLIDFPFIKRAATIDVLLVLVYHYLVQVAQYYDSGLLLAARNLSLFFRLANRLLRIDTFLLIILFGAGSIVLQYMNAFIFLYRHFAISLLEHAIVNWLDFLDHGGLRYIEL